MVLLCSKRGLGEATYKVKSKFSLGEMQIIEGDSIDENPTTYTIEQQIDLLETTKRGYEFVRFGI